MRSGIVLVALITAVWAAPTPFADDDPLRLPRTSFPISYDIELTSHVHNGNRAFEGTVKILLEISAETDTITLHSQQLTIVSISLVDSASVTIPINEHTFETDKSFVHITRTTGTFTVGQQYTIEIVYTGRLQTGMSGFYMSSYTEVEGVTR